MSKIEPLVKIKLWIWSDPRRKHGVTVFGSFCVATWRNVAEGLVIPGNKAVRRALSRYSFALRALGAISTFIRPIFMMRMVATSAGHL